MIQSSGCLSADDLSIRCRVRKSPFATNPKFDDAVEMTCTMRQWHPQRQSSEAEHTAKVADGPELVLTPVATPTRLRDPSPLPNRNSLRGNGGRRDSRRLSEPPTPPPQPPIHLALSDIVVVEVSEAAQQKGRRCKMKLTTHSAGLYEFDFESLNSHDVLLAFLQAHVARERIRRHSDDSESVPSVASTCSSKEDDDMDVDKLTAKHMRQCERESLSEKATRRASRLVNFVAEVCGTLCDNACCRGVHKDVVVEETQELPKEATQKAPISPTAKPKKKKKKHIAVDHKDHLEGEESTLSSSAATTPRQARRYQAIPAGLSMEESTVFTSTESNAEVQRRTFRQGLQDLPSGLSVEPEGGEESV